MNLLTKILLTFVLLGFCSFLGAAVTEKNYKTLFSIFVCILAISVIGFIIGVLFVIWLA